MRVIVCVHLCMRFVCACRCVYARTTKPAHGVHILTSHCVCVCVCVCGQVNTAHELQFASFNSLEEVVEKEEKMTEHVRVVLAREKELSETVARLKQVRCVAFMDPDVIGLLVPGCRHQNVICRFRSLNENKSYEALTRVCLRSSTRSGRALNGRY